MTLHVECAEGAKPDLDAIATSLSDLTKLKGKVVTAETGSLPNDGKIIADERDYDS